MSLLCRSARSDTVNYYFMHNSNKREAACQSAAYCPPTPQSDVTFNFKTASRLIESCYLIIWRQVGRVFLYVLKWKFVTWNFNRPIMHSLCPPTQRRQRKKRTFENVNGVFFCVRNGRQIDKKVRIRKRYLTRHFQTRKVCASLDRNSSGISQLRSLLTDNNGARLSSLTLLYSN